MKSLTLVDIISTEIFERLKLTQLSDQKKAELKEKMAPMIEQRILSTILEHLTPQEEASFKIVEETGDFDPALLTAYMNTPEHRDRIEEALVALIEELSDLGIA